MNNILTDNIEANSFLGLVTNRQKKNHPADSHRKTFVKVESKAVLMNLAIATVIIVMGLTAGSISQQKMELTQHATLTTKANV